MMFWILAALITLVSLISVGYPLFIKKQEFVDGKSYDKTVYKDQLDEIDREVERGQIKSGEAELARTEIARRLIALGELESESSPKSSNAAIIAAVCALVLTPVLTGVAYVSLGSPGRPDMPLQARMSADPKTQSIEELIARAEARVQNARDDVRGWLVLAPVYMRLGRAADAVDAYQNIIRLSGSKPEYESALGEALTAVADGMITAEARKRFEAAARADPNDAKAEYFLASALGQEGKHAESASAWETLIDKSPQDAPWLESANQELKRMRQLAGLAAPNQTPAADNSAEPGSPTSEDIAAAATMSNADRNTMIANMVAQLAEKLEEDPSNLKGWLRIIRSYAVLGRKEDAATAWTKAGGVFADDPAAVQQLNALAETMNIEVKTQ